MDSATLLYWLRQQDERVIALGCDYGQRHRRELVCARMLCEEASVEFVPLLCAEPLRPLLAGSALTSDIDVPLGHYEDESMRLTVVPNRNMILLSLAAGLAMSRGATRVAYAAHAGDHAIYPDCRSSFVDAVAVVLQVAGYRRIELLVPFLRETKGDIVTIGRTLGVPYELTWTCYQGRDKHCGQCGACVERREAFEFAGADDPVPYEDAA
jgi:7-cyano-7-deazaguanine synthase